MVVNTIKCAASRKDTGGLKAIFQLTLSGEDKMCDGREEKKPTRGKGVKYIIYLLRWMEQMLLGD